jgi:hypothetical protein
MPNSRQNNTLTSGSWLALPSSSILKEYLMRSSGARIPMHENESPEMTGLCLVDWLKLD